MYMKKYRRWCLERRWCAKKSLRMFPINPLLLSRAMACDGAHHDLHCNVSNYWLWKKFAVKNNVGYENFCSFMQLRKCFGNKKIPDLQYVYSPGNSNTFHTWVSEKVLVVYLPGLSPKHVPTKLLKSDDWHQFLEGIRWRKYFTCFIFVVETSTCTCRVTDWSTIVDVYFPCSIFHAFTPRDVPSASLLSFKPYDHSCSVLEFPQNFHIIYIFVWINFCMACQYKIR